MCRTTHDGYRIGIVSLTTTTHAELRMAQRNVSLEDIRLVLRYGKYFHRAGALIVYLRAKDIPTKRRHDKRVSQLEGTTVVLSRSDPIILTVYRNREHGLRNIKHKPRYSRNYAC